MQIVFGIQGLRAHLRVRVQHTHHGVQNLGLQVRGVGKQFCVVLVYAKSKFDNLRPEFLVQLKERFDDQN